MVSTIPYISNTMADECPGTGVDLSIAVGTGSQLHSLPAPI